MYNFFFRFEGNRGSLAVHAQNSTFAIKIFHFSITAVSVSLLSFSYLVKATKAVFLSSLCPIYWSFHFSGIILMNHQSIYSSNDQKIMKNFHFCWYNVWHIFDPRNQRQPWNYYDQAMMFTNFASSLVKCIVSTNDKTKTVFLFWARWL